MADRKRGGSDAPLFGGESGTLPLRLDSSSSLRNRNGDGCATPFYELSSLSEMIRNEREIAKGEREDAAKEQRRLMENGFELKLQVMVLKEKQSSGVAGAEPRAT